MSARSKLATVVAPFALAVTLHAACTPAELVEVAQVSSVVVEAGQKCLLAAYEAEQEACLTKDAGYLEKTACVAKVQGSRFWAVVKQYTERYYGLRCRIEPHKCPPPYGSASSSAAPSASVLPPSPWD